jgi:transcriptional regulator with XRE-family HTH domain
MLFTEQIINNLRKLMNDRGLTQAAMSEYADTSPSQFSKILNGTVQLSLLQLSNIARNLSMSEIDLITYPEKYVKSDKQQEEPVEAVLQIKLKKDKKDQVLKLVFGENNIEILNK